MSKIFDRFFAKIIALIVIIVFVVTFREMILTDTYTSAAFSSLMGTLPFSKMIVDVVNKILKYNYSIQSITVTSTIKDIFKLAIMACIQPLVVGLLTKIFLPLPKARNQILLSGYKQYESQEEYMNSAGYRIKSMIITILSAPFLAVLSAWLTSLLFSWASSTFGDIGAIIVGGIATLLALGLSLIPLLISVAIGTAILWRLLVTVLGGTAKTFLTNALCLLIYVSIIKGIPEQTAFSVIALIVWLIIADMGMRLLMKSVVG